MMIDSQLAFVSPSGAAQSMVGTDGTDIPFNNVVDLLGSGVGTAPANIIGTVSVFGEDPGIGQVKPDIQINVGTSFTTGNSATPEFIVQYAADQGLAGNYQPSTWYDAGGTGTNAVANLTAGTVIRMDIPPTPPVLHTPRFMRIVMRPTGSTHVTAGTISSAYITPARDDQAQRYAARNYVVA